MSSHLKLADANAAAANISCSVFVLELTRNLLLLFELRLVRRHATHCGVNMSRIRVPRSRAEKLKGPTAGC